MKRVKVTDEELAILEGLRAEKAIWNAALDAALIALVQEFGNASSGMQSLEKDPRKFADTLISLRKV